MTRVLFADDDVPALDSLRTRLSRESSRWQMVFVESATRAITELQSAPFDIIVVDAVAHHHDPAEVPQAQFGPLAALALARALLPSEESEAFASEAVCDVKVDASYLSSLQIPFDWSEAERRISQMLDSQEAVA